MAKKRAQTSQRSSTRRPKPAARPSANSPATSDELYQIVLRTREMHITANARDRELYPRAVTWNRLLTADRGRESTNSADRRAWHDTGHQAIIELGGSGDVNRSETDAFIASAAKCGEVQVEMEWVAENVGWAARVFPWESVISLATKSRREQLGGENHGIVVVRLLRSQHPSDPVAKGPICFAISPEAKQAGFDTGTERAAIEAAIAPKILKDLAVSSLKQFGDELRAVSPSVLHFVTPTATDRRNGAKELLMDGMRLEDIAKTIANHHPQLVALSSCHTGRRLAPLAIAHGAQLAIGFHDMVMDSSCPVFFGAFYREWIQTGDVFEALRQGLNAHNWKKPPSELGGVTIWSASDLIGQTKKKAKGVAKFAATPGTGDGRIEKPELIRAALKVTCVMEKELNYSMLHNKQFGLFAIFDVLKLQPGQLDDLEVTVTMDTGLDRPVVCHFFVPLPTQPDRTVDLMTNVMVPLGSELLRRRGEMIRGTLEVVVLCGNVRVFHLFDSIELPPCDEWKDDAGGRRFLPSFIFPRDPAVREILTYAQPFLCALNDDVRASFNGYQQTDATTESVKAIDPLDTQLRSIWGALQYNCRLEYANPPPSYTKNVQRVRNPEEILRSKRATCLELSLLLAACWEHIGIYPVIFLTKGHAFAGYWTSENAWQSFFDTKERIGIATLVKPADEGVKDKMLEVSDPSQASGGGMAPKTEVWLLNETHHFGLISREIKSKNLVAVEATAVARLEAFHNAVDVGRAQLAEAFAAGDFDGMVDVRTARDQHITPLAIITEGVVA